MSTRSRKKRQEQAQAEQEQDAPEVEAQEAPAEELSEEEQLRRERDEYLESWTRARADYQNLRRRLQSDIDGAVNRSKETLLLELLIVLDFLDMALKTPAETPDAQALHIGVEMTRGQLLQLLERENVRPVPADGAFDPSRHEAIELVESDEHPPGEIVETVRAGYSLGDRMLRHAHVKVSADPAAAADEIEETDEVDAAEGEDE